MNASELAQQQTRLALHLVQPCRDLALLLRVRLSMASR